MINIYLRIVNLNVNHSILHKNIDRTLERVSGRKNVLKKQEAGQISLKNNNLSNEAKYTPLEVILEKVR